MPTSRAVPLLVLAVLVPALACDDPAPGAVDGAACPCAPAEPPLAGRLVRVEDRRTVTARYVLAIARCPDGAMVLGGGCFAEGGAGESMQLHLAGKQPSGESVYWCTWTNPVQEIEVTAVAWATCLSPAP